jgi:uncharacterized phage protein gp47/JayE
MADYPFTPPDFLQGQTADVIQIRELGNLPDDIDKSENGIAWDLTRPPALEEAWFIELVINEAIKIMFPQWAYGSWLDLHATLDGVTRRAANHASATVTVVATQGITVPEGYQFATSSDGTSESVLFATTRATLFDTPVDALGRVSKDISVQAIDGGTDGNVAAGTIKLMVQPMTGIVSVTNAAAASGGTEQEDDSTLRERVLAAVRSGMSYTGCDADYVRWALEVSGVGSCVVDPLWNGAGTVRLIIADANGTPANQQILDAVYAYIVSPNDRMARLAPIGATVTVVAPNATAIDIAASVTLETGVDVSTATEAFKEVLKTYWAQAASEKVIKYVEVGSALARTSGVANYDHTTLTVNGGTADIPLTVMDYPTTGEVTLSVS